MSCSSLTRRGAPCRKIGIYLQEGRICCNVHSVEGLRSKISQTVDHSLWQAAARDNVSRGIPGTVVCAKISYGSISNSDPTFLRVFPNNKHQNRTDGFGCCSLSPMRLIVLGVSHSLENYYQGSKKFPHESWEEYLVNRERMFQDPTPHRHKFQRGMRPECTYFPNKDNVLQAYNYLDSRYYYCMWYEFLVQSNSDFLQLRTYLSQGMNLMLCGYDACSALRPDNADEIYHDTSTPFGHESVLFCLLTLSSRDKYPWRRYCEAHPELQYPM